MFFIDQIIPVSIVLYLTTKVKQSYRSLFIADKVMSVLLVNVWGKRFKLPQLTHESFLTLHHSCKIIF